MGEKRCGYAQRGNRESWIRNKNRSGRADGAIFCLLAGFFSYPHLHWQPQPITGADPDDG